MNHGTKKPINRPYYTIFTGLSSVFFNGPHIGHRVAAARILIFLKPPTPFLMVCLLANPIFHKRIILDNPPFMSYSWLKKGGLLS